MINKLWHGICHITWHINPRPILFLGPLILGLIWVNRVNMTCDIKNAIWWIIDYHLLFCSFCFVFCFLISFLLDHFQHTDSGNENIDWLNEIKWTTIQIYNIKGALCDCSIVWNMHRTVLACDAICCMVCLRISCESFIQTCIVVFKQNVASMISWTCI
jgi:hypothetical protein